MESSLFFVPSLRSPGEPQMHAHTSGACVRMCREAREGACASANSSRTFVRVKGELANSTNRFCLFWQALQAKKQMSNVVCSRTIALFSQRTHELVTKYSDSSSPSTAYVTLMSACGRNACGFCDQLNVFPLLKTFWEAAHE